MMDKAGYEKVVYLPGVFDLFHVGHLRAIQNSKQYGQVLIVGVQSDESVYKQKKKLPAIKLEDRKRVLFNVKGVDWVISYDDTFQGKILEVIKPDFLAVNETYGESDTNQKRTLQVSKKLGIHVVRIPYMQGISTTSITERIRWTSTTEKSKHSGR